MNILMATNTYLPHVGGVAKSVHTFTQAYREAGHTVTVMAPEYGDVPEQESGVIRVPALQNFNGSDFSVSLPITALLKKKVKSVEPDVIHSHHPFLLGDTALRLAAWFGAPLVFTYHTRYEHYTHYVPADSPPIRRFVRELATEYCNLCDHVIAPSESVRDLLRERGVATPLTVAPTGIEPRRFAAGDGATFRAQWGISTTQFVIGHVGRLAPEKNGEFLSHALAGFIQENPQAHRVVIVGAGPSEAEMRRIFDQADCSDRVCFTGALSGKDLVDAYSAMDLFAFASKTETQGMVLAEAMAAGVPVVALDAPGARDIVRDRHNGRLVEKELIDAFTAALTEMARQPEAERTRFREEARLSAERVSVGRCAGRVMEIYRQARNAARRHTAINESSWDPLRGQLKREWEIWNERFSALDSALHP